MPQVVGFDTVKSRSIPPLRRCSSRALVILFDSNRLFGRDANMGFKEQH